MLEILGFQSGSTEMVSGGFSPSSIGPEDEAESAETTDDTWLSAPFGLASDAGFLD